MDHGSESSGLPVVENRCSFLLFYLPSFWPVRLASANRWGVGVAVALVSCDCFVLRRGWTNAMPCCVEGVEAKAWASANTEFPWFFIISDGFLFFPDILFVSHDSFP